MPEQDDLAHATLRALHNKVATAYQDPANRLWFALIRPNDELSEKILETHPKAVWDSTVYQAARLERPHTRTLCAVGEPFDWVKGWQGHLVAAESELPLQAPVHQKWLDLAHECLREMRRSGRLSDDARDDLRSLLYWIWQRSEKVRDHIPLKLMGPQLFDQGDFLACTEIGKLEFQIADANLFQELLSFIQSSQPVKQPYLGITVRDLTVLNRGELEVDFGNRIATLQLVGLLVEAGPDGRDHEELMTSLNVTREALDKRKQSATGFLLEVNLEIATSGGRWTLVELNGPSE